MGQSLKSRFNGNTGEVVTYAKQFGVLAAMQQFQVKDYVAMLNFLKETVPEEEFQATKVNTDTFAGPDAFDKFCESMLRKYSSMETALKSKDARITELEKQVSYYRAGKWQETRPLVQGVMKYCEEK